MSSSFSSSGSVKEPKYDDKSLANPVEDLPELD